MEKSTEVYCILWWLYLYEFEMPFFPASVQQFVAPAWLKCMLVILLHSSSFLFFRQIVFECGFFHSMHSSYNCSIQWRKNNRMNCRQLDRNWTRFPRSWWLFVTICGSLLWNGLGFAADKGFPKNFFLIFFQVSLKLCKKFRYHVFVSIPVNMLFLPLKRNAFCWFVLLLDRLDGLFTLLDN